MKEKYFACCGLISFDPRITNKKKDKIDEPLETKYQFDGIVEKGTKDGEKHEKFMRMNCRDPLVPPPYPPPYTALPILQYDPAKPAGCADVACCLCDVYVLQSIISSHIITDSA